jgi:RNA polymerase sigma-70 factor (ECF subfamily)
MSSQPEPSPALRVLPGEAYSDWESVYGSNVVAVYRLVFRQVGNRPDAEDLTEEVFLSALPRLTLPAPISSVRAYLSATVRTVLADYWRRHYSAPVTVELFDTCEVRVPDSVVPAGDPEGRARRLLALLPERFRQILELRFLRGLSVRQAAMEMGVSTVNARVLQHRALRRAAQLVDEGGP